MSRNRGARSLEHAAFPTAISRAKPSFEWYGRGDIEYRYLADALGRRPSRNVAIFAFVGYSLEMSQHVPHDVSDFASPEEAAAYDRWFRARVEASLADPRPGIPHDQVMADMDAIIAEAERRRLSGNAK